MKTVLLAMVLAALLSVNCLLYGLSIQTPQSQVLLLHALDAQRANLVHMGEATEAYIVVPPKNELGTIYLLFYLICWSLYLPLRLWP